MTLHRYITVAAVLVAMGAALPASADPGKGNGNGKGNGKQARHHQAYKHDGERRVLPRYVANCPPGLAKKNPPCVPPGQVRNADSRYIPGIGDILRVGDYRIIRDPGRYDLEYRRGWDYYRDDNYVYRVDSGTRKVLAVLDLLRAFSN